MKTEWKLQPICSEPQKLHPNFFKYSTSGTSIAIPQQADKLPAQSQLNIDQFGQLGFPQNFIWQLNVGVPILLECIPLQNSAADCSSLFEHKDSAKETLQKWEQAWVFIEVNEQPHIVNPLGVAESDGKLRMVVNATASRFNDHLSKPKFSLLTHTEIISCLRAESLKLTSRVESCNCRFKHANGLSWVFSNPSTRNCVSSCANQLVWSQARSSSKLFPSRWSNAYRSYSM